MNKRRRNFLRRETDKLRYGLTVGRMCVLNAQRDAQQVPSPCCPIIHCQLFNLASSFEQRGFARCWRRNEISGWYSLMRE